MFDLDGCGLFVMGIVIAFLLWGGCVTGKDAAARHFSGDPAYAEFQNARATVDNDVQAARNEARRMVDAAKAEVKKEEQDILALEKDVEFAESLSTPNENLKDDVVFDEEDKKRVSEEFITWAGDVRRKEYGEAIEAEREAEHYRKAADDRLKTLEKSFWNKVGISRHDDKLYRDYDDKSKGAMERHDRIISKLQDEFFEIETKKALEAIKGILNGPHDDDGTRAIIERAKGNAARLRKEAEDALGK